VSTYFIYAYARAHHAVDEADGLQVLRRHDVLVVNLQFRTRLTVGDEVRAAAYLHAGTAVGRPSRVVEAHVALAADGHAQCTVAEHLDTYQLARGTADVLLLNLSADVGHLLHVQLAGQYHDVGKLGVEAQCLDVRYV